MQLYQHIIMRTAGLASILLLASGSVLGLPQYNQDNTDDGGSVNGEFWWQQGNAGTSGTSDIQDTLGNIFSQVVNAFNSTVGQVTSQVTSQGSSINSLTPQQSEYCTLAQDCVPWQLCQNDVISQGYEVTPGLVPYPEGAGYTGCGDVLGNVCCGIPKDVLDQQQQQSNAPNVYDTCSAGLQCVPIGNCNLYNGFIEPQVATYIGQTFVEYNQCTGDGATESVCCQAKPSGEQNQGGTDVYNTGDTSDQQQTQDVPQCASNQECVPYFQCENGYLNTDGAGLLDVRIKPKSTTCTQPGYPDIPAICCTDPSAPEPIVSSTYAPTPAPISSTYAPTPAAPISSSTYAPTDQLDTCTGYKVCVSQGICDASGNVITDGGELLDLRIVHKRCYVDGTTEVGVCCTPPGAPQPTTARPIPQIDICPKNSPCLAPSACLGEALDSLGSWTSYASTGKVYSECIVGDGYTNGPGVCCINPIPQIEICPRESPCLAPSACNGEALNSLGSWTAYAPTGNIYSECIVGDGYTNGPGVCCINPIPQIEICPRESPCLAPSACKGEALNSLGSWAAYAPTGIYSECTVGGDYTSGPGVCCINPIPQFDVCPDNSLCLSPSDCKGEALDSTESWTSYAPTGIIYSECPVGGGYTSGPGVCCINPPPPTPAPLKTCPEFNMCVPNTQCDANGNIVTDGSGLIDIRNKRIACIVDEYETGVCCKPPPLQINVVDYCPGQSVCVPELLCTGQALNNDGSMISYASGVLWSSCNLSGDFATPGICCENPPPPTPAPLITCSDNQVCVDQSTCDANGNVVTDGAGIFDLRLKGVACYTDAAYSIVGVCCKPPVPLNPVVNTCPGESSCVPELLCTGQVLDNNNAMTAYNSGGSWSQCPIGNDASLMGVCCINPEYSTIKPIPIASQCGQRNQEEVLNTRIQSVIAKNEAQFGEFPWQAIIFFSNYTFKCGASLIGDKWLLTGGHCVSGFQPSDIQIRLGEWQVNSFDEPSPYTDVQVKSITVHPDFNSKNVQNNIAVLELVEPVGIQYHINTICLPEPGQTFWGQRCVVSGWGKDSFEGNYQHILKKIELPTVEKDTCQALLRKTRLGKWFSLHDSFICAGGEENKDACKGDGGGPLACEDQATGRYVLAGMTSWGIGCGNKDVPGVYADVQGFSTWIQGVIGGTLVQQQQLVDPEVQSSNPYGK